MIHWQAAIISIALIQAFVAGCYYSDEIGWKKDLGERIVTYLVTTAIFLFGVVLLAGAVVLLLWSFIYHRILTYYHIPFIVRYVWLGKHLDYSEEGHMRIKERAKTLKPKWYEFNEKIFIWIDKWIDRKYRRESV